MFEQMLQVMSMSRNMMDDDEWMDYLLHEFLGKGHLLRKGFKKMMNDKQEKWRASQMNIGP